MTESRVVEYVQQTVFRTGVRDNPYCRHLRDLDLRAGASESLRATA